ncbi:MAG: hypothetical protein IPK92_03000 [Nitrospira sp.]|nr:hypothetical protein [Nitrospira sp.]
MQMMKRWFRRGFVLPAAAICVLSIPVTGAQAALMTYSFAGNLDGDTTGSFQINGLFKYDSSTVGSGGVYNGTVKDYSFKMTFMGSSGPELLYTSSFSTGANAVTITKNIPLGSEVGDRWELVTAASGDSLSDGSTPFSFGLRLNQIGGGLNLNVQDPPGLGGLNGGSARWRLLFEDADGVPGAYVGNISSLTAVPLPTAVLLFGAGLFSLVGLGAGGLRNLRTSKV